MNLKERLRLHLGKELEIYTYRRMEEKTGIPWTLLRDFMAGKRDLKLNEADKILKTTHQRITLRNITKP